MTVRAISWQLDDPIVAFGLTLGIHIPRRGSRGGRCFHLTCRNHGANRLNRLDGRYYCGECARQIDELCRAGNVPRDCELLM